MKQLINHRRALIVKSNQGKSRQKGIRAQNFLALADIVVQKIYDRFLSLTTVMCIVIIVMQDQPASAHSPHF